jgi:hypothetical protein
MKAVKPEILQESPTSHRYAVQTWIDYQGVTGPVSNEPKLLVTIAEEYQQVRRVCPRDIEAAYFEVPQACASSAVNVGSEVAW